MFCSPQIYVRPTKPVVWTPAKITSLKAWYRADTGVTDSSGVSQWNDQSANAHHLTSSGTAKPTYNATGGANNTPYLAFDGSDDKMAVTFSALSQPFHVFAILLTTTVSGVAANIAGSVTAERIHDTQGGCFVYFGGAGISISPAHSDTTNWYLWEYKINGASSSVIRGSGSATTGDPGSGSLSGITLGQLPGFNYANTKIAEVIISSAVLTGSDLTQLRTYMAGRYGVATN